MPAIVDWVTVSPKLSQKGKWLLKQGQELKLVYESQDLGFYEDSRFDHYFRSNLERWIQTRSCEQHWRSDCELGLSLGAAFTAPKMFLGNSRRGSFDFYCRQGCFSNATLA